MHLSRIQSVVGILAESGWGDRGAKDDSDEEYGSDLAKAPEAPAAPARLADSDLRDLASGIADASSSGQWSPHLHEAAHQFAQTVKNHLDGVHHLSHSHFKMSSLSLKLHRDSSA